MIGTVEIEFIGEPSTTLVLIATYTSVLRFSSYRRKTWVSLNKTEVLALNTSFSFGNFCGRMIGPVWRQAIANLEGSSASPSGPLMPPVLAWLIWQETPAICGSSNTSTHTLSLAPTKRNVVEMQPIPSACAGTPVQRTKLNKIQIRMVFMTNSHVLYPHPPPSRGRVSLDITHSR